MRGRTDRDALMHCGRVVVPAIAASTPTRRPSACLVRQVPGRWAFRCDCGTAGSGAEDSGYCRRFPRLLATPMSGFDGVELHCASGYLINQFSEPGEHVREDAFGAMRAPIRFPLMVIEALAAAIGPDRVGFRISPGNPYNGMDPATPWDTFGPFLQAASRMSLAYLHVIDMGEACPETLHQARRAFAGPIIANNMLDAPRGAQLIDDGIADAVAYGRAFIANPDLPERLRTGFRESDYALLYTVERCLFAYRRCPAGQPDKMMTRRMGRSVFLPRLRRCAPPARNGGFPPPPFAQKGPEGP